MPRDIVSERRHRHNLERAKVRLRKRMEKGGSGKHKYGSTGNDELPPPGSRFRQNPPAKGPKKYKWKRDVLAKLKAKEAS